MRFFDDLIEDLDTVLELELENDITKNTMFKIFYPDKNSRPNISSISNINHKKDKIYCKVIQKISFEE